MKLPALADLRVGVIGLGYVGLPLAAYLSRHFAVIGFLRDCNFYIVTVPKPVENAKRPDLSALLRASRGVGQVLSPATSLSMSPPRFQALLRKSAFRSWKRSPVSNSIRIFAGYSPERINPGDLAHRVPDIIKVTSGSTPEVGDLVDSVYATVITAGTHRANSIRVAEAAKVIENIRERFCRSRRPSASRRAGCPRCGHTLHPRGARLAANL